MSRPVLCSLGTDPTLAEPHRTGQVVATWAELRAEARGALEAHEADRIIERACGDDWRSHLEERAPDRVIGFVGEMVERRVAGEPLQYVLGRWGFRSLDLFIDRRVLIPRPETELVVEVALAELRAAEVIGPVVVDLGTGSGAIALSIATEVHDAQVWATDVSTDALAVARANLAAAGTRVAPRVRLLDGSWFGALPEELLGRVDLLVSNPPYIADGERPDLDVEVVDWEPAGALFAGPTGLEAIEHLLAEAPSWLAPTGVFVCEIGATQGPALAGPGRAIRKDLAGRDRILVARW